MHNPETMMIRAKMRSVCTIGREAKRHREVDEFNKEHL
jgi:hypothetical protein